MSVDPYHVVQQEIQSSLQSADSLRASYLRIRSTASEGNEELDWARNELKATLAALEADLEDLEESVKIVETTGPRMFGLDEGEVMERRQYVDRVRHQILGMRSEVESETQQQVQAMAQKQTSRSSGSRPGSSPPRGFEVEPDHQGQWAREEQQMMLREQDQALDSIGGTLTTLAKQAGLIGMEVGEHNELLNDLESGVDHTDSKLGSAMKKMKKLIRETEETKSGWCVGILIVVLMCLLLAVILV
ncbi:hypothetical protein JAAARDRAFT_34594 [Jaapia argillacea MUCL 33604]|uniref:t-SNARE coiled-coil homology domain-containing protein n=1 Tax=Jaapia argillacea MUCL 33604 TaxID=933084 RepID=A0A067PVI2_9AGAM|nr:hypothetical protein JAAARDRAFT_34594 [Jaapia argillacea MUCL 33604]